MTTAADRLFAAAGRVLRPGGELWTVYNSRAAAPAGARAGWSARPGPWGAAPRFVVTVSSRRRTPSGCHAWTDGTGGARTRSRL